MAKYKVGLKNIFLCSVSNKDGKSPIKRKTILYLFKKPIANTVEPI